MQISFQAILATDGSISFAIFKYEDGSEVIEMRSTDRRFGFDAGNTMASQDVQGYIGIFRIDGKHNFSLKPLQFTGWLRERVFAAVYISNS